MPEVVELTENLVVHAMRCLGLSRRELLLKLAKEHPAKFTNVEEVAEEWRSRIEKRHEIPYVAKRCLTICL